ncbi:MAG: hypothetical protein IPM01_24625 [Burkholderiaceae bacterium]|nr:hypothetical protein [Burkholderiaceae bacterium]
MAVFESNAFMTANTYLVKKIAMITKNGIQLPGIKNDRFDREKVTLSSRKYLKPTALTVINPSAYNAIGTGLMPKLELMPASDNTIIPTGRR